MSIYNGDIKVAGAGAIALATTTISGLMSNTDKVKLDGASAVIAFTPVVTSSGGIITSYTSSGNYIKVGRVVTINFTVVITNKGTATGNMIASLPLIASNNALGTIFESTAVGWNGGALVASGTSVIQCPKYDGTTPFLTGSTYYISATYFTT